METIASYGSSIRRVMSLPSNLGSPIVLKLKTREEKKPFIPERVTFVGWVAVFLFFVVAIPAMFALFFAEVTAADIPALALLVWLGAAYAIYSLRTYALRRASPELHTILHHGEIFIVISIHVTVCANLAFWMHSPGARLFDLGFYLIPEQSVDSPWRPLSDTLTIGLPIVMILYGILLEDRRTRCLLFADWFRMVGIAYLLRSFCFIATSLPGPAPHCAVSPDYAPPEHWRDILVRLGPMYGNFNTCGDLIFSGHASWTTITLLLFRRTLAQRWPGTRPRDIFFGLYLFTMCVFALAGRKHYTVDMVTAIIIATFIFQLFQWSWIPGVGRDGYPGSSSAGGGDGPAGAGVGSGLPFHTTRKHARGGSGSGGSPSRLQKSRLGGEKSGGAGEEVGVELVGVRNEGIGAGGSGGGVPSSSGRSRSAVDDRAGPAMAELSDCNSSSDADGDGSGDGNFGDESAALLV